jgi:hypothetical protein
MKDADLKKFDEIDNRYYRLIKIRDKVYELERRLKGLYINFNCALEDYWQCRWDCKFVLAGGQPTQ